MALKIATLREPVTFFDLLAQGRVFRADEREQIEQYIAAARDLLERACNRNDFHTARYRTTDVSELTKYYLPRDAVTISGVTEFTAGRDDLADIPIARVALLQLATDLYDARGKASVNQTFANHTFQMAVHALRVPASAPL